MKFVLAIVACLAVTGCTTADQQFFLDAATATMTGYSSGAAYTPVYQPTYTPVPTRRVNSTYSSSNRRYNTYVSGGSTCHHAHSACAVR